MRVFAPLPGVVNRVFDQGYLGVTFFFVLSGFVLTWSMRPGVPRSTFYWRRFARIWPSHMVALALAIPVFYSLSPVADASFVRPLDVGVLLLSVVLLQGWSANSAVLFSGNPAAWTLTVEALFYALHPWIAKPLTLVAKRGALLLCLGAMVWAFGYRFAVLEWPTSWLASVPMPITRVPEFLVGMGLAWAMRNGWRPRIPTFVGIASMAVTLLLFIVAAVSPAALKVAVYGNEIFTIAVGLVIVALASATMRGRKSYFAARWQVKLGEWSFAFYLIHATAIYLALRIFGFQPASWNNLWWFAGLLVVDIVLAALLYSLVERPAERRMRRWKDARDERRAARAATGASA